MEQLFKKTSTLMLALLLVMVPSTGAHAGHRKKGKGKKNNSSAVEKTVAAPVSAPTVAKEKSVEEVAAEKGISREELQKLPAPFRSFIYSLSGATVEVLFTAAQTLEKDYNLQGYTQVWVLPLYITGALGIEKFSHKIRHFNPALRALIYMVAFYSLEFTGGYVAKQLTGECPWNYTGATAFAGGILNGLHAPVWASLGLFAEQYVKIIQSLYMPKSLIDKIKGYFKLPSALNFWKGQEATEGAEGEKELASDVE